MAELPGQIKPPTSSCLTQTGTSGGLIWWGMLSGRSWQVFRAGGSFGGLRIYGFQWRVGEFMVLSGGSRVYGFQWFPVEGSGFMVFNGVFMLFTRWFRVCGFQSKVLWQSFATVHRGHRLLGGSVGEDS